MDAIAIGNGCSAEPGTLNFAWGSPSVQLTIHADGKVDLPPGMRPDETSMHFWHLMGEMNPILHQAIFLFKHIEKLLAALPDSRRLPFKLGDRVRLRACPFIAGRVTEILTHPINHPQKTNQFFITDLRIITDTTVVSACDFELEYDPLEQMAIEV